MILLSLPHLCWDYRYGASKPGFYKSSEDHIQPLMLACNTLTTEPSPQLPGAIANYESSHSLKCM